MEVVPESKKAHTENSASTEASIESSRQPGGAGLASIEGQSLVATMESITVGISKTTAADPEIPPWGPSPEEVSALFEELHQNRYLSFLWECPGRRNPNEPEAHQPEPEIVADDSKDADTGTGDFDFEEESTPMLRRPVKGGNSLLKGSAKKKQPTSLAGILSNMERHRIMDIKSNQGDAKPNS